ncbi:tRNA lysidine(34) synthetase TilS [Luteimonas sp. MC1572]|uniref:tRNA lysidine(34) synthetase TilS n=1 Tax=Luteimonas sp. MC1572 TaxID=2799325 RepID=UPI0018F095CA|nr:tRNA lysidine(34) synthetase TilS [Luteimonas sp. MC1572]MBJ6980445.1 tRNA lysidine(34) synthetase TilS [Luteimonas sp. MC1572]QQO04325.1 tRNA lysidine(34) synthetase TilS [Luteimonas sp. MC1572]
MASPPPSDRIALPDCPVATGAVLVALSGGLDSTVLLHLLAADASIRARGLRAVHVHHGLHADADAWAVHCARACTALDVPLQVARVDVARDAGRGLEAAARAARHAAFADALGHGEVLALAHHRDDQAETFLLRALRASGPDGLASMRAWRGFAAGWLWRPLLALPRATLHAWAMRHGLAWLEDPANADPAHDRNYLRHQVMPLLRARWPEADAALARSATLSAEASDLLAQGDHAALAAARDAGQTDRTQRETAAAPPVDPGLSITVLQALPAARRARVLRAWIIELALPPLPATGVAHITADLLHARNDSVAAFAWSDAVVHAWRGRLHAGQRLPPLPADWEAGWDGRAPLPLPGGGALSLVGAECFDTPLKAHARRGGERIVLPGRTHSHALKDLLQAGALPPWQRARMPLLSAPDGTLLAAGDAVLSARLETWLRARGAGLRWWHMA